MTNKLTNQKTKRECRFMRLKQTTQDEHNYGCGTNCSKNFTLKKLSKGNDSMQRCYLYLSQLTDRFIDVQTFMNPKKFRQ